MPRVFRVLKLHPCTMVNKKINGNIFKSMLFCSFWVGPTFRGVESYNPIKDFHTNIIIVNCQANMFNNLTFRFTEYHAQITKMIVYEYKLNSQIRSRQILLLENNQYCKNDNMEISFYILVVHKHCRKFIYVHIVMNIYLHDQFINTRIFISLLVNIAAVRLGKYIWVKLDTANFCI